MSSQDSLEGLKSGFEYLVGECQWLGRLRVTSDTLFGETDNVALLNDSASSFFVDLQRAYFEAFYMALGRLTDPGKSSGRRNMSIEWLQDELKKAGLLKKGLEQRFIKFHRLSNESTKRHRNRSVAHSDLETVLQEKSDLNLSHEELDELIGTLQVIVDTASALLGFDQFDPIVPEGQPRHVSKLLLLLKAAIDREDEELEKRIGQSEMIEVLKRSGKISRPIDTS